MSTATPRTVSPAALGDVIRPFVRAKVDLMRDPNSAHGAYLPRLSAIDIITRCEEWYDADVRALCDEGVKVFFYSGTEIIPWEKIEGIRLATRDAEDRRTAQTEIRVVRQPAQVAA